MAVVDFFIAAALVVSLCGAAITGVVLGRLLKDPRRPFRAIAPHRRRSIYRQMALMYAVLGGYFSLLIVHPFGLRNTFVYCPIIPFLACVRSHRDGRGRHQKPQAPTPSTPRQPSMMKIRGGQRNARSRSTREPRPTPGLRRNRRSSKRSSVECVVDGSRHPLATNEPVV